MGREEFAVLLPGTTPDEAARTGKTGLKRQIWEDAGGIWPDWRGRRRLRFPDETGKI
jgi:GGDEF domain-containing protein